MHNSKVLMLQDVLIKACAMLLFVVLARFLSTEEFGKYQQIILITSMLAAILSAGIPVSVSYFHGQTKSYTERISIIKKLFFLQLTVLFVGSLVFFIFKGCLSLKFGNEYIQNFSLLIIIILISNSYSEYFKHLSIISNNLRTYSFLVSKVQLLSVVSSIIVILLTKDIYYVLLITAFFCTLQYIILVKINIKYFIAKTNESKLLFKPHFNYIIAMGSVGLVGMLNGYVDQLMVSGMLPVSDFANLKIGAFQIPFISVVTGSLLTAMIPVLSKMYRDNNVDKIIETWTSSIEKATILLVPIIVFCLIFAHEIITSFFGEKYQPAVIIFQIYMFQWLRAVVIFGGVMGAIGLEKELFKNTFVITVLNVVLNYIMIINLGVVGAALTTTFLSYLGALLLIRKIDNKLKRRFFSYFPLKTYLTSLLFSVFICLSIKFILGDIVMSMSFIGVIMVSIIFYMIILVVQMKAIYNNISFKTLKELI